jgi:hypothetical protein
MTVKDLKIKLEGVSDTDEVLLELNEGGIAHAKATEAYADVDGTFVIVSEEL